MKQVWITRAGPPEVLELRDTGEPDPEPSAGEVRVRVAGAGINFADLIARMGLHPDAPKIPCVVGYEISGIVDALGPGVDDLELGARVVALTHFGGYSEVVCVPRSQLVRLPERVELVDGASIPSTFLTAWLMMVTLGNLQAGQTVLIHNAGGGVGVAALQIARDIGARTIGTASAGKHERLRELGIDHCVDYREQDFEVEVMKLTEGRGVDLALDPVGGASYARSYRCLGPLGRLCLFGASAVAPGQRRRLLPLLKALLGAPRVHFAKLATQSRGVYGVNLSQLWGEFGRLQPELERVMARFESGTYTAIVDRHFSFAEAAAAHRYMHERRNFGRVVLTPE